MLSVLLSRTNSTYSPGESVSGDLVIYAESPCSILDLTVNYCGISSVSFIVSEGEGKLRTCKKVEETDTHLDVLHPLVRSYRENKNRNLTNEERLQGKHFIYKREEESRRDCVVCSTRKGKGQRRRTTYYCNSCDKMPAVHPGICFERFHSLKKYKTV